MDYNEKAVAEYHETRKRYIAYGLDPYRSAEFIAQTARPLEGKVLEVGTGRGLVTTYLAKDLKIITVDIDDEVQSFAKELAKSEGVFGNITFLLRDITKEPYDEASFDIVVSAQAVHHFDQPEKMISILCKTASRKVVIADFNQEGFDILEKLHKEEGGSHSRGDFPIDNIRPLMIASGFAVKRYEKYHTVVYVGEK